MKSPFRTLLQDLLGYTSVIVLSRPLYLFLILFLFVHGFCLSQNQEERLKGYVKQGDHLTFVFDPKIYDATVKKVFVTGAFRNWDVALDAPEWELKQTGDIWTLSINNIDDTIIKQNSPFKFRVNNGEWMPPPSDAPNAQDGNLIFEKQEIILRAELRSEHLIWADIKKDRSLDPADYLITDAHGNQIEVSGILPNSSTATLIVPSSPLDIKRVYFLTIMPSDVTVHCSFDGWFRELYSDKDLGANVEDGKTTIRIFAPRANSVSLYLYEGRMDQDAWKQEELKVDHQGVWEIVIPMDLHGYYYDFTIHGPDDPGNHFYETNPVHINDPYARVSDDTWGKGRIWRKTKPATPLINGIPNKEDVIAYEVHVQDFTDLLPISDNHKGTFTGMITEGLRNKRGEKIGFDYLLDLGINVIHLMPVQEYVHFPDEDWKASFKDDQYMTYHGINEENYQWGYRTSFAMAVESRYRTKRKEPGAERDEFRDLVQAFHDKGIAVIIDIVPNHTAENMTENQWYFNFNGIDKQYYYRTKNFEHIGAFGNEVKTENRPMTQRWLIDQCQSFIDEFGIDGFRIDLAGQIDKQTLIALQDAIGRDKIIYGEAWIGSNDPDYENNPDWDWYKIDAPITYFQDDFRNAVKGPVFVLKNKEKDRGWAGGNYSERENVMKALTNTFKEEHSPLSGISYLDIHDNFSLADQFATDDFDGRFAVDQDEFKIAATLLYTTLGPIVIHGGTEIMRSKGHAPIEEVVKSTNAGHKQYMHGKGDTYNLRKANQFIWETVGQSPNEINKNDYKNMYQFWRGLNLLRKSELGSIFRKTQAADPGYYQWILPNIESTLGYIVDQKLIVLINAGSENYTFEQIQFPSGNWTLIGTNRSIDHQKGVLSSQYPQQVKGGNQLSIELESTSLLIWAKTESKEK